MARNHNSYLDFLKHEGKVGYYYRYINNLESLRGYGYFDIISYGDWYYNTEYTKDFMEQLRYFHKPNFIYSDNDPILELFSTPL